MLLVPSVTIRNLPDEVHAELAARAARSGRSLQEYLRLELEGLALRPDPAAVMAGIRERKRHAGAALDRGGILALRDAERR